MPGASLPLISVAAASALLFLLAFRASGLLATARAAAAEAWGAARVLRAPHLDDGARERAVQAAALRLVRLAAGIGLRCIMVFLVAAAPVVAADQAGLAPAARSLAFLERWDVIAVLSLLMAAGHAALARPWPR